MKHTLALVLMVLGIVGCATTPTTYDSESYENGAYIGEWKNGKWNGPSKIYYYNGQLSEKGTYSNGQRDGFWKIYNDNGQLTEERIYIDDTLMDSKVY